MPEANTQRKKRGRIALFRIAGILITIDYSWFIIFGLIFWSLSAGYFPREFPGYERQAYWVAGLAATFLFFFSVLFHELAHSLMAIRSGIDIPEITLFIFGGISRLSEEARDPGDEFKIAIVGPLSSFVLAAAFWGIKTLATTLQVPLLVAVFHYLMWINVALGIFNLIPGFPLDGGRVLRAFLWRKTGSLARATKWTSDIGKGFAVALMILGAVQIFSGILIGGLWLLFIGMFLRGIAEGGYQELVMRQSLEDVQVQEVMIREVLTVPAELSVKELIGLYFLRFGYKGFPVVRDGKVLGIVSLTEVKDVPEQEQPTTTVERVTSPLSDGMVTGPRTSLAEAMQKMAREGVGRLLVMQGDEMVGMITKTGLLRFLEIRHVLKS